MDFNKHSAIAGTHSFLSASNYHWVNYDDEKLVNTFLRHKAAARGTQLHNFASDAIRLGIKLPRTPLTLNMYVNDCLGFQMVPEQVLYYSPNCFGTADAIGFRGKTLRISDLKTGVSPTSMKQLEVYAAMFCLEYGHKPSELIIVLRIYKDNDVVEHIPDAEVIAHIMDRVVHFDKLINEIRELA